MISSFALDKKGLSIFIILLIISLFVGYTYTLFIQGNGNLVLSDLHSMYPESGNKEVLTQVNTSLVKKSQNKITILISNDDFEQRKKVVEYLRASLQDIALSEITFSNLPDFDHALSAYQFFLLTQEDLHLLKDNQINQIIDNAYYHYFDLSSNINNDVTENDFFKLLSRYKNHYLDTFNSNLRYEDELITEYITDEGKLREYVALFFEYPEDSNLNTLEDIVSKVNEFTQTARTLNGKMTEIIKSGFIFHTVYASSSSKKQITWLSGLSLFLIVLIFLYVFRTLKPLIFTIVAIVFASLGGFVVSLLIFKNVHIVVIVFGSGLIGVVVDYAIHFYVAHCYSYCSNVKLVKQEVLKGITLAMVTTCFSYLCLAQTSITVLKQIALFCCSGLFFAWLFVVLIFPIFSFRSNISRELPLKVFNLFPHTKLQAKKHLFFIFLAISVIMLLGKFSSGIDVFYKAPQNLISNDRFVGKVLNPFEINEYILIVGQSEQKVMDDAEILKSQLKQLKSDEMISEYLLISDFLPSANRQLESYRAYQSVVQSDTEVMKSFFESMSLTAKDISRMKWAYENVNTNEILSPTEWSQMVPEEQRSLWLGKIGDEYVSLVKLKGVSNEEAIQSLGNKNVKYVNNINDLNEKMAKQVSVSVKNLLFAYLIAMVIILAVFKTFRALTIIAFPAVSSLLTLSIIAILGIEYNFFHLMGLYLLLGVGLDYGIFLFKGRDSEIGADIKNCFFAVTLSVLTTTFAFGFMSFANLPVIKSFGEILFVGGAVNFLLLPLYNSIYQKNIIIK